MRTILGLLLCSALLGCGQADLRTPQQRVADSMRELSDAKTDEQRFYARSDAAKDSLAVGRTEDARGYATELLALLPQFKGDWNYGNAVQNGHVVLGRIAVAERRLDEAKQHLRAAGLSPGSPQMDTFGPDMTLASDLLEQGERDAVLDYFQMCRQFWKSNAGKLDEWRDAVNAGRTPDFGANVRY